MSVIHATEFQFGSFKLDGPTAHGQVVGGIDSGLTSERNGIVGRSPMVDVWIGGVRVSCLLDTGSQVRMLKQSFFEQYFHQSSSQLK